MTTPPIDGQGWSNKFALEFGVTGVPFMMLVDKQGNFSEVSRLELEEKVGAMLKE